MEHITITCGEKSKPRLKISIFLKMRGNNLKSSASNLSSCNNFPS